jgi:hypothetical protein
VIGDASSIGESVLLLVCCLRITLSFAALDFSLRRGVSDAHTRGGLQGANNEVGAKKTCRPKGCGAFGFWLRCSAVADLVDMLPCRASPEAKCAATNDNAIRRQHTRSRLPESRFYRFSFFIPVQSGLNVGRMVSGIVKILIVNMGVFPYISPKLHPIWCEEPIILAP